MGKKKKRVEDNSNARIFPGTIKRFFCYYCDKRFDDEKVLIQHQKDRHFKCTQCPRKLNTTNGLVIHLRQVHQTSIERVPNALPGKDSLSLEIYGMEGVPFDASKRPKLGMPAATMMMVPPPMMMINGAVAGISPHYQHPPPPPPPSSGFYTSTILSGQPPPPPPQQQPPPPPPAHNIKQPVSGDVMVFTGADDTSMEELRAIVYRQRRKNQELL